MNLDKLHVISVVSNPIRYKSRYNLYSIFNEDITRKGAKLWTIEMQTGARLHQVTNQENVNHIQIWSSALPGELWHKENLINIGIQQLTIKEPDWRYVCWVDADIKLEQGAIEETWQALQHWDITQMWSHAIDLDSKNGIINDKVHLGFMYCHWNNIEIKSSNNYSMGGHSGYAWGARREAINKLGGLIDFAILGSADRHMACALIGQADKSVHGDMHPTYKKWLFDWQDRAEKNIKRNVGYVHGTLRHLPHGKKANRGYASRWKILVDNGFNPETDIKKDVSGLWQMNVETPRQMKLRDDIRRYFRSRQEDELIL